MEGVFLLNFMCAIITRNQHEHCASLLMSLSVSAGQKKKKVPIVCVLEGGKFNEGAGHAAFQTVVRLCSTLCCVQGLQPEYREIRFASLNRDEIPFYI